MILSAYGYQVYSDLYNNHIAMFNFNLRANDRKLALKIAEVNPAFSGHACRGNLEMCIYHAAAYSDAFDTSEARRRARHHQSTQDRYYSRPPDSRWVSAVAQIPEARRKRMLPEEFIRVI